MFRRFKLVINAKSHTSQGRPLRIRYKMRYTRILRTRVLTFTTICKAHRQSQGLIKLALRVIALAARINHKNPNRKAFRSKLTRKVWTLSA